MEESRHDFAFIGMQYMGMDEVAAYKFADEMLEFIKGLVYQYVKEMMQNAKGVSL